MKNKILLFVGTCRPVLGALKMVLNAIITAKRPLANLGYSRMVAIFSFV